MYFKNRKLSRSCILHVTLIILTIIILSYENTTHANNLVMQKNIEKYFATINNIKNIESNFIQINTNSSIQKGNIKISRPGFMRLNYSKPSNITIICDGKWMIVRNILMDETSYLPLNKTPIYILISHPLIINKNIYLKNIKERSGLITIQITLNNIRNIMLTLIFTKNPFKLKQWTNHNIQNNCTNIILENLNIKKLPFKIKLFQYHQNLS